MLCAGFLGVGGKDVCSGDSGGPLFITDDSQQPILIGVVSFGRGCASASYPGVFIAVKHYHSWITSVVPDAGRTLMSPSPPPSSPSPPSPPSPPRAPDLALCLNTCTSPPHDHTHVGACDD
eukprot:6671809-Prymnesium_polylepis.1